LQDARSALELHHNTILGSSRISVSFARCRKDGGGGPSRTNHQQRPRGGYFARFYGDPRAEKA
jgi:hypothetical protein